MTAGSTLQGYLLKANREYRKTNLIGGKYKKRWVELTVDTLVYAGSQQELLTGKIQVFSVHELLWVCAEGTAKFKVKFPERALTFKVESGSSAERDKWVAALAGAKQAKSRAAQQALGAEKLEQLQKTAEQQLLDPQNDGSLRTHRPGSLPGKRDVMAASAAAPQDTTDGSLALTLPATPPPPLNSQPPSPRSLLASAKTGQAFVSHSSESGHAHSSHHTGSCNNSKSRWPGNLGHLKDMQPPHNLSNSASRNAEAHDSNERGCNSDDGNDGGLDAPEHHQAVHHHPAQQNHSIVPRPQIPSCNLNNNCSPQNNNSHSKQADSPLEECSGSESPRTSLKRANLARRVTPGVLLIPPRSPSAQRTPTTSEDQIAASATSSNCGSGWTAADQVTLQQPDHHSSASATRPVGGRQDEQILTLDPSEGSTQQRGAPHSFVAGHQSPQGGLNSTSSGPAQGSRPGSAQYRPGPPLKSCLRQSGCAPQLAMLLGSASSPTSSAAAMAAAVDDAEGSGGWSHSNGINSHSGRRCQSSPLGRQPSPANSHKPYKKSLEPDRRDWLQDDWDEESASSSCDGDDHDDGNENDGCPMVAAAVKGGTALVSSTAQLPSKQAADAVLQVAGRGAVQGVRADENWLADDFDDD